MSMNMHCNIVELWQTPTWLSYLCLMKDDGTERYEVKGKQACAALRRYLAWVQGLHQYSHDDRWKHVNEVMQAMEEAIKNNTKIEVWVI